MSRRNFRDGNRPKYDDAVFTAKARDFLTKNHAGKLPSTLPVFLDEKISPKEAFQSLATHKLRACPVKSNEGGGKIKIVGTMDQRDAVLHVLDDHKKSCSECRGILRSLSMRGASFKQQAEKSGALRPPPTSSQRRLSNASLSNSGHINRTSSFSNSFMFHKPGNKGTSAEWDKSVKEGEEADIKHFAVAHPFRIFTEGAQLTQIIESMANGEYLVGVDGGEADNGGIKGLVDQIAVADLLSPLFEGSGVLVKDVYRSSVLPVKVTETVVKTFEVMVSKGTTAVALVDDNGCITQNFSVSDIKIFFDGMSSMDLLHLPVEDYMQMKESIKETKERKDTRAPISVCHQDDDVHSVLHKLVKTGFHRVWVVDVDKKPLGILSLTDVFRMVADTISLGTGSGHSSPARGPSPDGRKVKSKFCSLQ
jgi:CBS domain-containing protein